MTCFHKTHEGFGGRQHRDNLIRGALLSPLLDTDVKIGVLDGRTSAGKEIGKRRPIDMGDIPAIKLERQMLERGKIWLMA